MRKSGLDVADIYSRSLGREIRYEENDLDVWGKEATRTVPGWLVHDLKLLYEFFQRHGLQANDEYFALQEKRLGHLPRSFHTFVRETVTEWRHDEAREYTKAG